MYFITLHSKHGYSHAIKKQLCPICGVASLQKFLTLFQKLKRIQIVVPFDVPQSHCVETRFTHVPTEEQKRLLADLGVQLKYKKFSSYEDAVICKNWKIFSKVSMFNIYLKFVLVLLMCQVLK